MTMAEESKEVREARPVWEAEVPWVVAYLREDIQDLRGEIREMRRSIERLDAKIDARTDGLDAKIEELRQDMDAKIEGLHREMSVQFRWTVATIVAVGALILAALKLLP